MHKNTPRSPCGERGAKTKLVLLRQDSCKSRSYAAGGARYLQADLMLLTHAGCAFKDPRGRFGISNTRPRCGSLPQQGRGKMKSETCCAESVVAFVHVLLLPLPGPDQPQFRTAALRSNRQCGAAALRTEGPLQTHPQPFGPENYLYRSTRRVRCS